MKKFVLKLLTIQSLGFPDCSGVKNQPVIQEIRRQGFDPWVGMISWTRKWQPTPAFLPGNSLGQRNLAAYSPWSHKESDMTEGPSTNSVIA